MSTDDIVWNGMTKAALDGAYNNMAAVQDSAARLAFFAERSAELRARMPDELDIPYGPRARNRFDVFRSGSPAAPLAAFIHGGWWQRNSKEAFACVAEGALAHGFDVALLGYTLAPEASLRTIVDEIHAGLDALMRHQASRGATQACVLFGWSAGGHLTACGMKHGAVVAGLAISGAFDLTPIRHSYINDKLKLDPAEAEALSPIRHAPTAKPFAIAFGLAELPEMRRQSADYGAWCLANGVPALGLPLDGHDHFSILDEPLSPQGALTRMIVHLGKGSRKPTA